MDAVLVAPEQTSHDPLDANIPASELETRFHLRAEAVAALQRVRPSVTSFVARPIDGRTATKLAAQVDGFQVA